jgi:phosphoribosylanthranilate isomerase
VNATAETIHATTAKAALHFVQLHGDEPPAFLKQLKINCGIIRARRLDDTGMSAIRDDLRDCREIAGMTPSAILIDAAAPGIYGGSGQTADWRLVARYRDWIGEMPLILAGGLTPDNVAAAIALVRPHAVDVASGVEASPGKKDPVKLRDFIAAARAAFPESLL